MTKKLPFFEDVSLMVTHLAFYPIAYLTILPEVRGDLLGIGSNAIINSLFWIALCACAYTIFIVLRSTDMGPLTRFGAIAFMLGLCVLTPVMVGFVAMALTTFAVGGFAVIGVWWKGAVFLSYLWIYLRA